MCIQSQTVCRLMEKGNTVTGKTQEAGGRRQGAGISIPLPSAVRRLPSGFTLLELMIVISVIIILVSVALPQYQKTVMHARETVLKDDLHKMRDLIDQYAADKGKLPQSLDDLVTAGYMREVPKDPITDAPDWVPATGKDPYSTEDVSGLTDVHSSSSDVSSEGKPYSEW
jgi:general secretion pathway protein G